MGRSWTEGEIRKPVCREHLNEVYQKRVLGSVLKTVRNGLIFKIQRILSTGEQLLIAYELLEILADKGFSRVIVFGDEANHVSPDIEIDLYRSNFEAFSARNLQFVFTGNPALFDKIPHFHELFPNVMELTGFADHKIMDELLDTYCNILERNGASINFPPETRDILWKISNGIPREVQRVCQEAVDYALVNSEHEISPEVVLRSCVNIYSFVPRKPA